MSNDWYETFDLDGEADVLTGRHHAGPRPLPADVPQPGIRVKRLAACRESSEFDFVLMDGMVQQTLHYVPGSPGVILARHLGLRPMDPEFRHPRVSRVEIRRGRATAVLFEIDGDYFLYCMTSAAKSNERGENDWTNIMVDVLTALRPEELYVASVSRLVRSFEHAGTLLSAVTKHVDVVHAGHTTMRMRGKDQEIGHMMWNLLTTVAASERNLIVQRLTAGIVAKYRRGEWVKGLGAVPLGYQLEPGTKRLSPDPDQLPALVTAWTLMADRNIPAWKILQRLGDMGVVSPLATRRYGKEATVAQLKDAETYLTQLRRWSTLYLTGTHTTRWANPFEGAPHIAGMPVHPSDKGGTELRFEYNVGLTGIDPALIQAGLDARRQRAAEPVTGGAAHERVAPLSGVKWTQGGMTYWLTSVRDAYDLRVRGNSEGTA